MALESKRINVSELDFDKIKANLKEFLRGQTEFSDYDFEGSGLSNLLDVLAYNTHYNGLYQNLSINEMFLDSATKRNSVVSIAKGLGYTPYSARCSEAVINFYVSNTASSPTVITLPKGTPFSSSVDGTSYTFYTTENITAVNDGTGTYKFNNVTIKEGTPLTYKYTVADGMIYTIPNADVDISTLTVRVQESQTSSNFDTYNNSKNLLNVSGTDKVYFIKEIDNQLYEIVFGDGIIGNKLSNGNVIHFEYFVTKKDAANGSRVFNYNGSGLYGGTTEIVVVTPSFNGTDRESIESIKFNAPRSYLSQNRAVSAEDYKTLIYNTFPEAGSVAVWGGEDNIPAVYGKVFICIKPKNALVLTTQQKNYIQSSILEPKSVVSVTPELVDPEYLDLELEVTFYYDSRKTTRTVADLETLVTNTILTYNENDLQMFDGIYRQSKLTRLIDLTEPSIINSHVTFVIHRQIDPRFDINAEYIINIINPIYNEGVPEEAVRSSGFYISGSNNVHYVQDDGLGTLQLYYVDSLANKIIVNRNIGTVTYAEGKVHIKNLNISSLYGDVFELIFKTQSNDVVSAMTQIALINSKTLKVTGISDPTATGNIGAGNNYIFTSSRN